MSPLYLLHALNLIKGTISRRAGRLGLPEETPKEVWTILQKGKDRLLNVLKEEEELALPTLLEDPFRLALLLWPQDFIDSTSTLTIYLPEEEDPSRFLVPPHRLVQTLQWHAHNFPRPRRIHLADNKGQATVDVEPSPDAVALEDALGRSTLFLYYPLHRAKEYVKSVNEASFPREITVWHPEWGVRPLAPGQPWPSLSRG